MGAELGAGADGDGSVELVLRDCLVSQGVHPHGDLEVIQVVQEKAKVLQGEIANKLIAERRIVIRVLSYAPIAPYTECTIH